MQNVFSMSSQPTLMTSPFLQSIQNIMGSSWYNALESELSKPYFTEFMKLVEHERSRYAVYPPREQVFSWTHYCDINNVKVIILGQEPYRGVGQAHGLSFSVQNGSSPPPTLKNIFKELKAEYPAFNEPDHGDLTGWARQGVLLLNTVLTFRAYSLAPYRINVHKGKGWEAFTDAVITWISTNLTGVVFMLWGNAAQTKASLINPNKHLVLLSSHPSPLSARLGFSECKHFSKANEYLAGQEKPQIDWNCL